MQSTAIQWLKHNKPLKNHSLPLSTNSKASMPYQIKIIAIQATRIIKKRQTKCITRLQICTGALSQFFGRKLKIQTEVQKQGGLSKNLGLSILFHTLVDCSKANPNFYLQVTQVELNSLKCVVSQQFIGTAIIPLKQCGSTSIPLIKQRACQCISTGVATKQQGSINYSLQLKFQFTCLKQLLPDFIFMSNQETVPGMGSNFLAEPKLIPKSKLAIQCEFSMTKSINLTISEMQQQLKEILFGQKGMKAAKAEGGQFKLVINYHSKWKTQCIEQVPLTKKKETKQNLPVLNFQPLNLRLECFSFESIISVLFCYTVKFVKANKAFQKQIDLGLLPIDFNESQDFVVQTPLIKGPLLTDRFGLIRLRKQDKIFGNLHVKVQRGQSQQQPLNYNFLEQSIQIKKTNAKYQQRFRELEQNLQRSMNQLAKEQQLRVSVQKKYNQSIRNKDFQYKQQMQNLTRQKVIQEKQIYQLQARVAMLQTLVEIQKKKKIQFVQQQALAASVTPLYREASVPQRVVPSKLELFVQKQGLLQNFINQQKYQASILFSHSLIIIKIVSLRLNLATADSIYLKIRIFNQRVCVSQHLSTQSQENQLSLYSRRDPSQQVSFKYPIQLHYKSLKSQFASYLKNGSAIIQVYNSKSEMLIGIVKLKLQSISNPQKERVIAAVDSPLFYQHEEVGSLQMVLERQPLETVPQRQERVFKTYSIINSQPLRTQDFLNISRNRQQQKIRKYKMTRMNQELINRDHLEQVKRYREENKQKQIRNVISSLLSQFRNITVQCGKAQFLYFNYVNSQPKPTTFKIQIQDNNQGKLKLLTRGLQLKFVCEKLNTVSGRSVDAQGIFQLSPGEQITLFFKFISFDWLFKEQVIQHLINIYVLNQRTNSTVNGFSLKVIETGVCPSQKLIFYQRPNDIVRLRFPALYINNFPSKLPRLYTSKKQVQISWLSDHEIQVQLKTEEALSTNKFVIFAYRDEYFLDFLTSLQVQIKAYQEVIIPKSNKALRHNIILNHQRPAFVNLYSSTSKIHFHQEQSRTFPIASGPFTVFSLYAEVGLRNKEIVHCVQEQGKVMGGWLIRSVAAELLK